MNKGDLVVIQTDIDDYIGYVQEYDKEAGTLWISHDKTGIDQLYFSTKEVKKVKYTFDITLKQFEVLEDVLSEIEESRVYQGEDKIALDELKEQFSYEKYCEFKAKARANDESN